MDESQELKTYNIDLFQTARVHTERITEQFANKEEAEARANELAKEKGIDPDFEINEVVVEQPTTPAVETSEETEDDNAEA